MAKTIKKITPKIVAPTKVVETKVESTIQIVKYVNKNVQISPRKLRLVVDRIRPLSPVKALASLKFTNNKSARILVVALQNVISDAKHNFNLDAESLKFELIKADEGLKIKRMDKAHGSRFARGLIQKRHSRLVIHVKGNQN